jgi:N-acetylneuraminic acid mutarotase
LNEIGSNRGLNSKVYQFIGPGRVYFFSILAKNLNNMNKSLLFFTVLLFSICVSAQWVQRASLPGDARHHPVTFVIDGKAYLLTGMNSFNNVKRDFYEYDPGTDQWTQKSNFPGSARAFAYGASMDGKGYIGFGVSSTAYLSDLWEYDPVTDNWTQLASCPGPGRRHPAFVALNGKIYMGMGDGVVGGVGQNFNDWYIYTVSSDSWKQGPDLDSIERHHPYYFHAGGQVYAGFGHSVLGIHRDFYKFDVNTETWERMKDFTGEARVAGTQFSFNGKGYILAGDGSDHRNLTTGEFYEYNHTNDTWTQLTSHPDEGRWAPGSFVVGDTAYYLAGETGDPGVDVQLYNDMWAYGLTSPIYPRYTGINEISEIRSFETHPNPTTGMVNLPEWIIEEQIVEISLADMTGRKENISLIGRKSIDLSDKAPQFYLLSVRTQSGELYRSRILKR